MRKITSFAFGSLLFLAPNLYAQDPTFEEGDCDNFMDPVAYPAAFYSGEGLEGEIIGYTQGESQTITFGEHSDSWSYSNLSSELGIFTGGSTIDFSFDGTNQFVRFHLGESSLGPETGRSFSVNGSTYISLDGTYPMTVSGVTVDLDTSAPDLVDGYHDVYLTFSGTIEVVSIRGEDFHESSIVELCVEPLFEDIDCDDFTNAEEWFTEDEFGEGETLGYTQGGDYAVTCTDGHGWINSWGENGISIGEGSVDFAFSGANQTARFLIYHIDYTDIMTFSVNGSSFYGLGASFPLEVDGVTVEFDTSPEDPDVDDDIWGYASYITFSGDLSNVEFSAVECGILELCVEPLFDASDCDDFTNLEEYPIVEGFEVNEDMVGDVLGTTQGGTQPITISGVGDGWLSVNDWDDGFYGGAELGFAFDGTSQTARFLLYGYLGDDTPQGFSVNGSALIYYDDTFPMEVDGIMVDIDDSPEDIDGWHYFYLTLSGEIDMVNLLLFESGVIELCVEPYFAFEGECDDFTVEPWPMDETFGAGETIGYTQGGEYPVTVGEEDMVEMNTGPSLPGIFINNTTVNFEFSGEGQFLRFELYNWFFDLSENGFFLNDEPITLLNGIYPVTVDGVEIDLEIHDTYVGSARAATLTFDGEIENIVFSAGEMGITELCYSADSTDIDDTGIESFNNGSTQIYPNPTTRFVTIEALETIDKITIYSISGQEVLNQTIGKNYAQLDLSELLQGVYIIKITQQNGIETIEKLIRE